MNKNTKTKNFFYALDIGSKKMTLAAGDVREEERVQPFWVETQPTKGIFKGVVNDLALLSESIQRLFKKMETRLGVKATKAALSINGNYIEARDSVVQEALSERGTRSITRRDIERIHQQARILGLELDEYLLHEYPQGYSIDRHNMILNPLGLHGRRLEAHLLLVSAKMGYIENITRALEHSGLDVINITFSGVAAAHAVLTSEEKENGVILVDIGDTLTGVLIFKDGIVRRVNVLAFGGKNICEIVSNFCKIPLEAAEEVKKTSGMLMIEIPEDEEVMIKIEDGYKSVKKKELALSIQPEIDKFLGMLKNMIFESGVADISAARVVVTGGLSLLEGLLEKMETVLGLSVRMGVPRNLKDIPSSQAPAYACAIGLLQMQQKAFADRGFLLKSKSKNKLNRLIDYVANLYQDYF